MFGTGIFGENVNEKHDQCFHLGPVYFGGPTALGVPRRSHFPRECDLVPCKTHALVFLHCRSGEIHLHRWNPLATSLLICYRLRGQKQVRQQHELSDHSASARGEGMSLLKTLKSLSLWINENQMAEFVCGCVRWTQTWRGYFGQRDKFLQARSFSLRWPLDLTYSQWLTLPTSLCSQCRDETLVHQSPPPPHTHTHTHKM